MKFELILFKASRDFTFIKVGKRMQRLCLWTCTVDVKRAIKLTCEAWCGNCLLIYAEFIKSFGVSLLAGSFLASWMTRQFIWILSSVVLFTASQQWAMRLKQKKINLQETQFRSNCACCSDLILICKGIREAAKRIFWCELLDGEENFIKISAKKVF